ncbi:phage tail assembly protein [Antarcticirhabdus aurantiaca]|uniref:phage tail assembly protein n=1 Tax=Antarcticirhabdus aurantiaca TaxID=2606717 RepID=UPI00131D0824|nr:phage tail assembly protein [Antarcticirhabdus aurantiaca]
MTKNLLAVGAGSAATTIELRRVTKADEATIGKLSNHNRQLEAYLCFGTGLSLSELGELRLADVGNIVVALAKVEGCEIDEPVGLPVDDGIIWMTADADDRAPIYRGIEQIYAVFATDAPRADVVAPAEPEPEEPAEPELPVEYLATAAEISVPLQFPFKLGEEAVSVIRLLPPSFGDVEAVLTGRMAEIEMIGRMASVSVAALRALRWPDAEKVTAVARILMPATSTP